MALVRLTMAGGKGEEILINSDAVSLVTQGTQNNLPCTWITLNVAWAVDETVDEIAKKLGVEK